MTRQQKRELVAKEHLSGLAPQAKLPLLTYLQGILPILQPTERLIAECMLADPERIIRLRISEIKRDSGASVGSIVAFCRRLGLKGFAEFKIALARDMAQSVLSVGDGQPRGSLFQKVLHFHGQSLLQTVKINSEETVERVVETLKRARKIEVFSIGLSYPVAYTAYCKFLLIGLSASSQFDSHIQLINATQLKRRDVAFGISCSGSTRETVQCLQVAKKRGATTICLTNAMKSPITTYSDLCLYATPSEVRYFQAPLASRVTQLAVLDALFVSLALKCRNRTAARLQQTAQELNTRRFA
jgi:RpiR family transcriptional regulator, carbohydrate utilization regulator